MFIKMERSKTPMLWFSLFFLVILCSFSIPILAQEVDDERDFDYVKGSKRGPEHWGELRPAWAKCKTGEMQSPIDLLHRRVKLTPKSEEIKRFYKPGKAILKNRGHDIEVEWKDESSKIQINGTDYILQQSHWHSPSEHTINGKRYDMEVHIVHQSKDGKIAVIGRLYKIGKPNKFLKKLEKQIKLISDTTLEIDVGIVNPAKIKMRGKRFYRYTGSLTTPPCTEGVIWSVNTQGRRNYSMESRELLLEQLVQGHRCKLELNMKWINIGTVSKNQLDMLRKAVYDHAEKNARPLQRINGRKVNLYAHMIKNRHD